MVFLFSSCEENDSEWRRGEIAYPASIPVPPNGMIRYTFDIGYEWVDITGSQRYDYIDDLRYRGGSIYIYEGPFIRNFTLSLENSNAILPVRIDNPYGGTLDSRDPDVDNFLYAVAELIKHNGFARIYIDGSSEPGRIIELDFYLDLDVYVFY